MSKDEKKLSEFDLTELINFGYYVRKHPGVVMRENYLKWKEINDNQDNSLIDTRKPPIPSQEPIDSPLQLTKLEHFSGLSMVGFSRLDLNYADCAEYSVKSAKALMAELAKEDDKQV